MTTESLGKYAEPMLNISTAHLKESTAEWIRNDLASEDGYLSGTPWSTYGWILWTNTWGRGEFPNDIPADLANCLQFARVHGFLYLKLDCDAETVNDLPVWADNLVFVAVEPEKEDV